MREVKITDIERALPKRVVDGLKKDILPIVEQGSCFSTAAQVGMYLEQFDYIKVEVCFGLADWIGNFKITHGFNRVIVNGKEYYIDVQYELYNDNKHDTLIVVETMNVDDVVAIFDYEEQAFCPFFGYFNDDLDYVYYDGITRVVGELPEGYSHLDKWGIKHEGERIIM